jgi:TonB-linked SusC/RagA family outer membrane protein
MQFSFAQQKTVTGTVTSDGVNLPGATVSIAGTQQGTQTDENGKFSIKASQGDVLEFSFLGKDPKTVTVGAGNVVNVVLATSSTNIEVVQIVGALGIKRTRDAIVSTQKQIGNRELTQAANPNAVQALTGKVSGLQITTVSNGVSPDLRIVLRGARTLTGDNQALIVIDGAISSATILAQLPPDIIQDVNVIKGAQGAALYGAQGVNGAIVVTTKKGSKTNKFTFGINSGVDFETVNFVPQTQLEYGQGWANDPGFADSTNPNTNTIPGLGGFPNIMATFVPWENGSWGPAYNTANFPSTVPVGMPQADGNFLFTDWKPIKDNMKQFFKTGTVLQNGFNFNVGGPDSYAFLSANRQNTDFVVDGDQLVRNSFIFKAGKKINRFSIGGNVNYITQTTSQTDSDLFDDLIQTASNVPVSRFKNSNNEGHWTVYAQNPYWISKAARFDEKSDIMNGIIDLSYELNKNVSVSYLGNIQLRSTNGQDHRDEFTNISTDFSIAPYDYYGATTESYEALGGTGTGSSYYEYQTSRRNIYNDFMVNFNYDLTSDLNLKFNIGSNIQDRLFREMSQGGKNLDVLGFYHISNVLNPDTPTTLRGLGYNNRTIRTRTVAGFANADLAYKDYLFLNVTGRIEQSSFVKDSYFYPSVGVSFIPTKAFESLKDNKVLNYAKLNASYTSVGNTSAVQAYETNELTRIPTGFPYNGLAALSYNPFPTDPNIKPEFVNTFEVGGQFGFFNDRITLEGSYYVANTKDLISNVTASNFSGNQNLRSNIGDLENKGFEIDLGFVPVKTKDFRWDIRGNYSTFKTKITKLAEGQTSIALQSNSQIGIFAEVGEEFPLIKGTTFQRDANGNILVDNNGAPLTNAPLSKLGKGVPDYIIGLTNSFEYKGFKLTAVADFRTGASTYSFAKNLLLFTGGDLDTAGFDRTQGYVVPGVNATTGLPNTVAYLWNNPGANGMNGRTLDYFTTVHRAVGESSVVDAAALKIRELSLSYALPKKLIERAGLESLRFGVNARNPFVFLADGTLIKAKNGLENNGYGDPEASNTTGNAQGLMNIGQYPTTRTLGFSVNLTF